MVQKPDISILMATYNGAHYLEEALESIHDNIVEINKSNTPLNLELVIIDDGSTDQTKEIVDNFSKKMGKTLPIKYHYQKNQGQAQAFQNSLNYLEGEITMLLDSDDKFLNKKIIKVWEAFNNNPTAVMVTHPQLNINASGERTGAMSPKKAKLTTGDVRDQVKITGSVVAPASSGLSFKTSALRAIHPSPACGLKPCSGADSYLSLACCLLGPVIAIQKPYSEYRKHNNGKFIKRMTSHEGLKTQIELQNRFIKHLNLINAQNHNSYFARTNFAYTKISSNSIKEILRSFKTLISTTIRDNNFSIKTKPLLIGFWTINLILPKKLFWKVWTKFITIK
jgi:glycosyltransferase involved in cell wall biosynthesis